MRKIVISEILSLDGVTEDPAWSAPYINDEQLTLKMEEMAACDGFLLGRVTYQDFARDWPPMSDEDAGLPAGFSARMNSLPKWVVSTTLKEPLSWNATLIQGDLVEEITKLKQQPGQDIVVMGSTDLARTLAKHDLVDEYRFLVYPVVVGKGKRLFEEGTSVSLKLIEAKSFKTGIAVLTYQPDRTNAGT